MFRRILLNRPRLPPRRTYATPPPSPSPSPSPGDRIARLNRRLPRFLRKYTSALANAPLSHITSFLILHELTAIVPLFSLAAYFHYTHWLPSWFAEGAFVLNGVERFGKYFRRKGWIRTGDKEEAEREVREAQGLEKGVRQARDAENALGEDGLRKVDKVWNVGEGGVRLVVEFATAYAITKALIVPRVVFSVWATPGFARWTVVPLAERMKGFFRRGRGKSGAVEGGVGSKGGGGKGT